VDYLLLDSDLTHFQRAVELAWQAEGEGNLPIGCVIALDGRIVAEGKNSIFVPEFDPRRHAEIEALQRLPRHLLEASAGRLTLYSTLEPCLMCTATILHHGVGKVLFGAWDKYGGSSPALGHMPPYYEERFTAVQWSGPVLPETCDPLLQRAREIVEDRQRKGGNHA
jgi:tRNA(adenine34) deaminase